jgi:hypothetical protein
MVGPKGRSIYLVDLLPNTSGSSIVAVVFVDPHDGVIFTRNLASLELLSRNVAAD